ncbi:RAT1-interacting protein, partial [Tremellales sp. Uapishka_1]
MVAPFEEREGWEMTAVALDGSVYIEQHDPPEIRAKRRKDQSSYSRQSYMGYSYESFSTVNADLLPKDETSDHPEGWSGDVNTNVQWCNVVRSAIGDIPLCLGGEVDCVERPPGDPNPGLTGCIELKTNKVIENPKQEYVFHKKLLKHWAQSWLLGVPKIEVGFRSEAGILQSQRTFETLKIPRLIASLPNPPWTTSPCYHFLYSVLSLVALHVMPTDPKPVGGLKADVPLPRAVVWRFSFVPRRGCELYRVGDVDEKDGRWGGVLSEEYVRWRMSQG